MKVEIKVEYSDIKASLLKNTTPSGCSYRDKKVLENIENLINMVDSGIFTLHNIANQRTTGAQSVDDCILKAAEYLNDLKITISDEEYDHEKQS